MSFLDSCPGPWGSDFVNGDTPSKLRVDKLTIDFETRSPVNLKKCGAHRYAEHPWTDVMCLCYKADDKRVNTWAPPYVQDILRPDDSDTAKNAGQIAWRTELINHINAAEIIEAHNVGFEIVIWNEIMVKRYGFPPLPFEKLRCSAAKAAVVGLPRALGKACEAMKLPQQKDEEGSKVMMKLTKPRRPVKKERTELYANGWTESDEMKHLWITPEGKPHFFFHENPDEYLKMIRYCEQDVVAEHCLSEALPELSEAALELWRVDAIINARGVVVDQNGCNSMIQMCNDYKDYINAQIQKLTDGEVDKGTKVQSMVEWLSHHGVETNSLAADILEKMLRRKDIPDDCRKLLEYRRLYSKTSVSKYEAAIRHACNDSRIRGMFLYHGAHTGRWAGRGVQLQNLPSRGIIKDPETALEAVASGCSIEFIEHLWDSPLKVASSCIRSVLTAGEGNELIVADYSAIEGRILAWLAGEDYILDAYMDDRDTYKIAAAGVYEIRYDDVDKDQRQVGKVIELACIAKGELVLTDKGEVPIEDITLEHKLWDGVDFVSHGGAIYKGRKRCWLYQGLIATSDHLVWTHEKEEPVQLAYAMSHNLTLAVGGPGGAFGHEVRDMGLREVFDTLNAGPRNRFTVSGKLVHNCGYQGYVGAFQAMAKGYGLQLTEEVVKDVVLKWRRARPMTVKLWEQLYAAAVLAMTHPGRIAKYRMIQFKFDGTHLKCRLPSGRILWYPFARIRPDVNPWGKRVEVISYMTQDSVTRKWHEQDTYGGKMAENCTQGVSADIISCALIKLHKLDWHPVLHVHDEVGCEEPTSDKKTVKQLCEIMCDLPPWAEGLPVKAAGWKGKRYKK